MSVRSERIKTLIVNSGLSYQELEKLTGIKKSSLQRYASGATPKIPLDVIEKLATYFNVRQEYLMGWDEKEKPANDNVDGYTDREQKLIHWLRSLPPEAREAVLRFPDISETSPNSQE